VESGYCYLLHLVGVEQLFDRVSGATILVACLYFIGLYQLSFPSAGVGRLLFACNL